MLPSHRLMAWQLFESQTGLSIAITPAFYRLEIDQAVPNSSATVRIGRPAPV